MTTISIALATFNGARFLPEQLESLARQVRRPDELVVADDGSTDRTLEIVHAFAASAPFRVVVLPQQGRLGYRANFMRCAEHCTGDLIAFCDQDDVWDPGKLDDVERAIRPSTLLLQHGFRVVDADLKVLPGSLDEIGLSASDRWAPVLGLVQVFRRSLLTFWPLWAASVDQNAPTERMAHDQWVYFLAGLFNGVQILHKPLLSYRQHGRNTCGLDGHGLSYPGLHLAAVLGDMIRGRPSRRRTKRALIVNGLERSLPAARGRSAIISDLVQRPSLPGDRQRLQSELRFYEGLASYCERRLTSYESTSRFSLAASLLKTQPDYLMRGGRGMKDFLLDVALNA